MERKKLAEKTRKNLNGTDKRAKRIKRYFIAGAVVSAIDPSIGIPITFPGIAIALKEAISRASLRRRLLKNQETAMLLAKEFRGTKHEEFFDEILKQIEKNKQQAMMKKYVGLRVSRKIPLRVGLKRLFKK